MQYRIVKEGNFYAVEYRRWRLSSWEAHRWWDFYRKPSGPCCLVQSLEEAHKRLGDLKRNHQEKPEKKAVRKVVYQE